MKVWSFALALVAAVGPCQVQPDSARDADTSASYVARVVRLGQILSTENVRPASVVKEIPGEPKQSSPDTIEIRTGNVITLIRTSENEKNGLVREVEMHFDPNARLTLRQLTDALGPSATISEGETSSVEWREKRASDARIYATLFTSRVTPDALVLVVRIRTQAGGK